MKSARFLPAIMAALISLLIPESSRASDPPLLPPPSKSCEPFYLRLKSRVKTWANQYPDGSARFQEELKESTRLADTQIQEIFESQASYSTRHGTQSILPMMTDAERARFEADFLKLVRLHAKLDGLPEQKKFLDWLKKNYGGRPYPPLDQYSVAMRSGQTLEDLRLEYWNKYLADTYKSPYALRKKVNQILDDGLVNSATKGAAATSKWLFETMNATIKSGIIGGLGAILFADKFKSAADKKIGSYSEAVWSILDKDENRKVIQDAIDPIRAEAQKIKNEDYANLSPEKRVALWKEHEKVILALFDNYRATVRSLGASDERTASLLRVESDIQVRQFLLNESILRAMDLLRKTPPPTKKRRKGKAKASAAEETEYASLHENVGGLMGQWYYLQMTGDTWNRAAENEIRAESALQTLSTREEFSKLPNSFADAVIYWTQQIDKVTKKN